MDTHTGANASVIAELDRLEAEANSTLDMLEDLAASKSSSTSILPTLPL